MNRLVYDLGPGVTAFSTMRDTDSPDDHYSGFNACHYTGDNEDHIASCRHELTDAVTGLRYLVIPRQTHSLNVALIDRIPVEPIGNVDALVTDIPGIALAVNTADCVPVLMADTVAGVVSAVHSGWRGTAGHIVLKALDVMVAGGAVAGRVKAVMGPSICTGCFEVGPEVAAEFEKAFPGAEGIVSGYTQAYRPHVDLRAAICHDLVQAGVPLDSIDTSTAPCSRCNPATWWSARYMGIDSGRTLSVIMRVDNV